MKVVYDRFIGFLERAFGSGGILAYHGVGPGGFFPGLHVTPETLGRQLEALSQKYRIVSLTEFVERLRGHLSVRGYLAVTFDDAYLGVARYAEPILRELEIPATVFVVADPLRGGENLYWWDVVEFARVRSPERVWLNLTANLGLNGLSPNDPKATRRITERVFSGWAGRGTDLCRTFGSMMKEEPWRSCTIAELQALSRSKWIEFGCHTVSHAALPLLERNEQIREIEECYAFLKDRLSRVTPFLAYPYGRHDPNTMAVAQEVGMEAAFSVKPMFPSARGDSIMAIPRLCAVERTTSTIVARNLARAHRPVRILWKGKEPRAVRYTRASKL